MRRRRSSETAALMGVRPAGCRSAPGLWRADSPAVAALSHRVPDARIERATSLAVEGLPRRHPRRPDDIGALVGGPIVGVTGLRHWLLGANWPSWAAARRPRPLPRDDPDPAAQGPPLFLARRSSPVSDAVWPICGRTGCRVPHRPRRFDEDSPHPPAHVRDHGLRPAAAAPPSTLTRYCRPDQPAMAAAIGAPSALNLLTGATGQLSMPRHASSPSARTATACSRGSGDRRSIALGWPPGTPPSSPCSKCAGPRAACSASPDAHGCS